MRVRTCTVAFFVSNFENFLYSFLSPHLFDSSAMSLDNYNFSHDASYIAEAEARYKVVKYCYHSRHRSKGEVIDLAAEGTAETNEGEEEN